MLVHQVAIGFATLDHDSLDASPDGNWLLYLGGGDLYVSRGGAAPRKLDLRPHRRGLRVAAGGRRGHDEGGRARPVPLRLCGAVRAELTERERDAR